MDDFVSGMKAHLESDPALSRRGKRILEVINSRPSRRRTRVLERMERHARAAIHDQPGGMNAFGPAGLIDWSKVDWNKVISTILDVLIKLLPLLLAL